MTEADGRKFRAVLEAVVAEQVAGARDVALLLSGGIDSTSVGLAARAAGCRVHAYVFDVAGYPSVDRRHAADVARAFGWPLEAVTLRPTDDELAADLRTLAARFGCVKKTHFECTWPFLRLAPLVRESVVLDGIAADGHFGVSRKALQHKAVRASKGNFDAFRREYFAADNPAASACIAAVFWAHGKRSYSPYLDLRLFDFLLGFDWDALNKPRQKMPALLAYPNEFRRVGVRPHRNLQLVAGVDERFASLLGHRVNARKRTRMLDVYRTLRPKPGRGACDGVRSRPDRAGRQVGV